ncbi:lipid-A-disaccharide synthase [Phenylobacterium immobile]|uniref:lipid-A-disaccharide synthase n=1 Tax=Phenylobacterium immobile TaxID=21 RepID=UPI000B0D63DB|nr:lipid-A-disaccharide synthase [Phenylobacterium immobile]
MTQPLTVMLVAAEASGDDRGAALARALRHRLGIGVRFVGVGGARLAEEGVRSPFDIAEISVLGLLEGLAAYPRILRRVRDTVALATKERPDIVVLIDSWGFTLRVAQGLRRALPGVPLIKYVGPQVWATRPGRAKTLAKTVDRLLSIHAFDAPWFERYGLPVTFVGNSALSLDFTSADPARLRTRIGATPDAPILLIAPGSRRGEITRLMPHFGEAVWRLARTRPDLQVVIPAASTVVDLVKAEAAVWPVPPHVVEGEVSKLDAMKAATVALACSGTVTSEIALAGAPLVVAYRVSPVTYALLKHIVRTPYITLMNIAAQAEVAPEFIQERCEGLALAKALAVRLDDPAVRTAQIAAQDAALEHMGRGQGDPSARAAEAVLKAVESRRTGNP